MIADQRKVTGNDKVVRGEYRVNYTCFGQNVLFCSNVEPPLQEDTQKCWVPVYH